MAKFRFVEWLLLWLLETEQLGYDWDSGNLTKSTAKHCVSPDEVEEVFDSRMAMVLGVQTSPTHEEERYGLLGRTRKNRILMISFTLRQGRIRPISARPANSKERKSYETFIREVS